jgi:hypothetical protein
LAFGQRRGCGRWLSREPVLRWSSPGGRRSGAGPAGVVRAGDPPGTKGWQGAAAAATALLPTGHRHIHSAQRCTIPHSATNRPSADWCSLGTTLGPSRQPSKDWCSLGTTLDPSRRNGEVSSLVLVFKGTSTCVLIERYFHIDWARTSNYREPDDQANLHCTARHGTALHRTAPHSATAAPGWESGLGSAVT